MKDNVEKALNELEEEAKWCHNDGETLTKYDEERFNVIRQDLATKSKKEQALEIIVNKGVNVKSFQQDFVCDKYDYEHYLKYYRHFSLEELTKEEFDFLVKVVKEIMEDE